MTLEELIAFRDKVALPKLLELFDNTQIPEGACYIDNVTVGFLDGRSCGYETGYKASGFQFIDGKVQKYLFEEADIDLQSFSEVHKDCIFVSDGKLQVYDELNELDLTTTIRNMGVCGKLFHEFENLPNFNIAFSPIEYHKMEYLWNNRTDVIDMDTHDFKIEGFMGTWRTTDHVVLEGSTYYLMECETWGVELPGIIVDASGKVIMDEVFDGLDAENVLDLRAVVQTDKFYADVVQQMIDKVNETSYGEPQAWIYLNNGRTIEVTFEQEMLSSEEQFYSVRLHCNEKELEGGEFHGTLGVMNQLNTKTNSMEEIKGLLYSSLLCNDHYFLEDYYKMDDPAEDLQSEHKSLDSMIQNASSRYVNEKGSVGLDRESGR